MYKLHELNTIIMKIVGESTMFIPASIDNLDYQDYLKWLEEGNTPEPADERPQE